MFHQRLLALGTNAWYFVQYGLERAVGAQFAVVSNTKAVSFIANALHHIKAL